MVLAVEPIVAPPVFAAGVRESWEWWGGEGGESGEIGEGDEGGVEGGEGDGVVWGTPPA